VHKSTKICGGVGFPGPPAPAKLGLKKGGIKKKKETRRIFFFGGGGEHNTVALITG